MPTESKPTESKPIELDVKARVVVGDREERVAAEAEVELVGPRAGPARQRSAASAEWARKLETQGDLHERTMARNTAFSVQQRYFHDKHGEGTVTAVDAIAGVTMAFDGGETHTYDLASRRSGST